jgi:multiple sugar transport system substrate-binding protein
MRARSRRDFLALGAGATAGALLAGCQGGGPQNNPALKQQQASGGGGKEYTGPKVDLQFWNGLTGGDGPYMRRMVQQFNNEHDNIKVAMSAYPWDEYYQKLATSVQSGRAPNIGIIHLDSLPTNAARNVVSPLDDVASALGLKEADFDANVWKAGIYKGQRYGIPLDIHPIAFFYNKTTMKTAGLDPESPPKTRADYEAALAAFKKAGIQGQWIFPGAWPTFPIVVWQFGGELWTEGAAEAAFNSPQAIEGLSWVRSLIENGHSPKNVGTGADGVAFQNGKNPFWWHGPWNINALNEVKKLDWGVTELPQIGSVQAAMGGSHNLVLPRQRTPDKNKLEASKVFVNWLSTNSLEWAKAGQVPARNSVREGAEFAKLTAQTEFAKELPYIRFMPAVPGLGDVYAQTAEPAVNKVLLLKEDPKTALDKAAEAANKLLEDNRKKYGTS